MPEELTPEQKAEKEYNEAFAEFDEADRTGRPVDPRPPRETAAPPQAARTEEPETPPAQGDGTPPAREESPPSSAEHPTEGGDLAAKVADLEAKLATAESRRSHTEGQFTRLSQEISTLKGQLASMQTELETARADKTRAEAATAALRETLNKEGLTEEAATAERTATAAADQQIQADQTKRAEVNKQADLDIREQNLRKQEFTIALDRDFPWWKHVVPPQGRITTEAHKAFVQHRALQPQETLQRLSQLDPVAAQAVFSSFAQAHPEFAKNGAATSPPASSKPPGTRSMRPSNSGLPEVKKGSAKEIEDMDDTEFQRLTDKARQKAGVW